MRLAELFRLTALGIALLCWLDPPVVVAPQPVVPVDVALVEGPWAARPTADGGVATVAEQLLKVAQQLRTDLAGEAEIRVHEPADPNRLPCDAARPCVLLMGPGAAPVVPADRRGLTAVVRVGSPLSPNVEVVGFEAQAAHITAEGLARVWLDGRGVAGRTSTVRLYDGVAVVGEAEHRWAGDGPADVELAWSPLAAGPRRLDVRVVTDDAGERSEVDNRATTAVVVEQARWPIRVFERRPSWATAFARRALEQDGRFDVASRTEVAPRIAAGRSDAGGLGAAALERTRVVVVGAPDALTVDDVDQLERFVRRRGGSVVLVPDRALAGPVTRLLRQRWREQLAAGASVAGGLRASEWLLAEAPSDLDEIVSRADGEPAVVTTPTGAGRVTVVGALDAWRHREADEGFRRFWQGLVGRAAVAAGPTLALRVSPPRVAPGVEVLVEVQVRRMGQSAPVEVAAEWQCEGEGASPVRLWPAAGEGAFWGRVLAPVDELACVVIIEADGLGQARSAVTVSGEATRDVPVERGDLDGVVQRTGGVVTTDAALEPLYDALRAARPTDRVPERRYPMRSWWWLLPFVSCLGAEWWLRRRAGLR